MANHPIPRLLVLSFRVGWYPSLRTWGARVRAGDPDARNSDAATPPRVYTRGYHMPPSGLRTSGVGASDQPGPPPRPPLRVSMGSPDRFGWDFGDSGYGDQRQPTHAFGRSGRRAGPQTGSAGVRSQQRRCCPARPRWPGRLPARRAAPDRGADRTAGEVRGLGPACLTAGSPVCIIHTMTSREIIRRLTDDGWYHHHTKGDHHQFKHGTKPGKVTVPHPQKDFPVGTLKNIFKQAGWDWR